MELSPVARTLVTAATLLLVVAALATGWEFLAAQSPSSPWHIGVLPGPVGELRSTATVLALVLYANAWLVPWLRGVKREPWILTSVTLLGVLVTIVARIWGATTGMYGVQFLDPRPDSQMLLWVRVSGECLLALCLLELARRVVFRRR